MNEATIFGSLATMAPYVANVPGLRRLVPFPKTSFEPDRLNEERTCITHKETCITHSFLQRAVKNSKKYRVQRVADVELHLGYVHVDNRFARPSVPTLRA